MDTINETASTLNQGLQYLHENALAILVCVAVLYSLKQRLSASNPNAEGHVLQQAKDRNSSIASADRRLAMEKARQRQQEEASKRSREAAEKKKFKEQEERKRRNEAAAMKYQQGGHRLGNGTDDNNKTTTKKASSSSSSSRRNNSNSDGGYNPMQPWTSSSGRYRAPRRTARRG